MIHEQVFEVQGRAGELEYRIQVKMPAPHVFMQRHIFTAPQAITEPWIPSLKSIFDDVRVRGTEAEVQQ